MKLLLYVSKGEVISHFRNHYIDMTPCTVMQSTQGETSPKMYARARSSLNVSGIAGSYSRNGTVKFGLRAAPAELRQEVQCACFHPRNGCAFASTTNKFAAASVGGSAETDSMIVWSVFSSAAGGRWSPKRVETTILLDSTRSRPG